jgi:hypothetical protein
VTEAVRVYLVKVANTHSLLFVGVLRPSAFLHDEP